MPLPLISRRGMMAGAGAALLAGGTARAAPPAFRTVTPGVITIANSGEMPMVGFEGDRMIGSDAEMVAVIAAKLGLGVKSALMEWSATVQSVRSGRADIMVGNMGWTPARAQALLITDAIYYGGAFAAVKADLKVPDLITTADMKGRSIGTITGFTIVPEMKKVPGTTEVKLYDNSDAAIRDVVAGRLDFALLDGPLMDYIVLQNPGWGLKTVALKREEAFPQLTSKQHTVMGMNQENHDLFDAVNAGVKWLWASKTNAELMRKYGIKNPDYLDPPTPDPRVGVDRTAGGGLAGPGAHTPRDFSALFA
jgi:ABC-type amino acid transport substrate-binding protein